MNTEHYTEATVVLRFVTKYPLNADDIRAYLHGWSSAFEGRPTPKPAEFVLAEYGKAKDEAAWVGKWKHLALLAGQPRPPRPPQLTPEEADLDEVAG